MMTLNEIRYNPATFWLVGLALKNHHTHGMPLRIELTERHTHHKQVKVVHYYIKKGKLTIAKLKSHCSCQSAIRVNIK